MIGTISIKVNAAKPNFPLQPMFAFMGSPSSIRVLDVPKSIGNWAITTVKVAVLYPDNTTVEKTAVRNGSVWVATLEGCEIAGKVLNGYSVLADGIDEDGNEVSGYVLGKGDVFILENDTELSRLVGKIAVRYVDDIPDVPTKGDLMNSNGELRLFDGNNWILISTGEHSAVYDSQITIKKNGTEVGSFTTNSEMPVDIDIPVPSRTSDIENDSGFITVEAIPSDISSFNNDVGYITASALPTKVSELENDSGFITLAQIPTPSCIEDATGNRINADLSCTYIDNAWEVTDPSSNKYVLEYVGFIQSHHIWECVEPENIKLVLTYANDWELQVYTWQETGPGGDYGWVLDINGSYDGDSDITTIPYFVNVATTYNYSAQRPVTKHLTLATKDELPVKVSELQNDVGYITASQVPPVPSNLSDYNNDVGFITASAIPPIPSKTSDLTNDSGFITASAIPSSYSSISDANGNLITASGQVTWNTHDHYGWQMTLYGKTVTLSGTREDAYWSATSPYAFWDTSGTLKWNDQYGRWDGFYKVFTDDRIWEQKGVEDDVSGRQASQLFFNDEHITGCVWTVIPIPAQLATLDEIPTVPSNVGAFTNDVGYLTASSSAFTEKRDKTDLVYKVGFDKDNLDKVVKFVVEYVDGNNQNVTATLDKYDEFTQTWTGDNTNWKVYTYLVGMEPELYFALNDGTSGQDGQPAPSQGAEDTSWNFTYNSNPATWTMVMTQNIALQQDFKNLRDMKDISYPASVDSTGMYTIQKFNVNGTEVAHFTASGSTSTWDTNDPVVNQYEISTTDGTNFTLVSGGIQIGTFTMTSLKNGVVDLTYSGSTYTVGAVFKQTTFALKDYVDSQIGSVLNEQF